MLRAYMNIRLAKLLDIATLREFEQGVIAAERPFSANLKEGEIRYYDLEALINSEDSELLVAETENQLVACGYARIEWSEAHIVPSKYAYLGFMYVKPAYRGQKLIGKIMAELFAWSEARGVEAFKLDVYSRNESAIRAYQKLGFEANFLQMWKKPMP
jgi:ribosomal protein S18 acetylase RimI-like enzyme